MDQRISNSDVGELIVQIHFFNSEDNYVIKYVRQNGTHVFRCLDSHMQILVDMYLVCINIDQTTWRYILDGSKLHSYTVKSHSQVIFSKLNKMSSLWTMKEQKYLMTYGHTDKP
jgi:hypothetical protein